MVIKLMEKIYVERRARTATRKEDTRVDDSGKPHEIKVEAYRIVNGPWRISLGHDPEVAGRRLECLASSTAACHSASGSFVRRGRVLRN